MVVPKSGWEKMSAAGMATCASERNTAESRPEILIAAGKMLRQGNNQDDFADFGGLNADPKIDPALGAGGAFDPKKPHHNQQDDHQSIQPGTYAAEKPIVDGCK